MLTRTQMFVIEEFLESPLTAASIVVAQETKKRNEEDSTVAGSLSPMLTATQTENKQVTNFTIVTICTAHSYQAHYFLMPNTRLSCFDQPVSNRSYFSVCSSGLCPVFTRSDFITF
jgi:hypothetical protein